MMVRRHREGGTASEAVFTDDGRHRLALTRCWDPRGPRLLVLMLNPSTADERVDDPTVARCAARARAMGQGAFRVCNLFAYRATRPADLRTAADPVGPGNDAAIREGLGWADAVLCAWGHHGTLHGRSAAVRPILRAAGLPLLVLGLTRAGEPRHPLYVAAAVVPRPWQP